jgi:L-iditol 2-dehydrogenase
MAFHHIPCGQCFYCRKKTFAQCERYKLVGTTAGLGEAAGGGFAQYIRVMDWIVGDGVTGPPGWCASPTTFRSSRRRSLSR